MNIIEKLKGLSTAQKVGAGIGLVIVLGAGTFLGYQALVPQENEVVATATVTLNKTKEEAKKAEAEVEKVEQEKAQAEAEVKKAEEEKQKLETELANATTKEKKEEIKKQIEEKAKIVEAKKETVKKVAIQVEEKKQEVAKKAEEVKKAEVAVVNTPKANPTPNQDSKPVSNSTPSQPKQPETPKDVVTTKEVVENGRTEAIAFATETRQDANLEKGKTRVEREGQNGQKVEKITYTVTYTNGSQTSKTEKSRSWETTSQPVSKIVVEGTKVVQANKEPHENRVAAEAMAARINEIRASKGLPLATFRYDVTAAKRQYESGKFGHWQNLGENLGRDANRNDYQSGRKMVDSWMKDGHATKIVATDGNRAPNYIVSVYKVYHGRGLPVNWYVLYEAEAHQ